MTAICPPTPSVAALCTKFQLTLSKCGRSPHIPGGLRQLRRSPHSYKVRPLSTYRTVSANFVRRLTLTKCGRSPHIPDGLRQLRRSPHSDKVRALSTHTGRYPPTPSVVSLLQTTAASFRQLECGRTLHTGRYPPTPTVAALCTSASSLC